jgi:hypothetical protein
MISARTRTIVIGVVTAVWAANFIAGVAVKGYQPSESINGIFMAIVGGLFALGARGGTHPPTNEQAPPAQPPPPVNPPASESTSPTTSATPPATDSGGSGPPS